VLHLAAPGVAGSKALRQLCQHLKPAAAASGGQQLLLEQPGPHSSQQVMPRSPAAASQACDLLVYMANLMPADLTPLLYPNHAAMLHPSRCCCLCLPGHRTPGSCPHHCQAQSRQQPLLPAASWGACPCPRHGGKCRPGGVRGGRCGCGGT
jgi:hypothetical protein